MDKFSSFNPKATLLFYLTQIITVIVIFNPVLILISFASACVYKLILDGKKGAKYIASFVLPLIIVVALFNMLFTHYGVTELFHIGDTRFTLESMLYGASQGLMLTAVLLWFNIYSTTITTEAFISVFGRVTPNLALILSMAISFIPRMRQNAQSINEARMLYDTDSSKLKRSLSNLSALVTLSLEQSIETADSMKARGFNKDRSVYSKYRFNSYDFAIICIELILFVALIIFKQFGFFDFIYEPEITLLPIPAYAVICYGIFAFLPVIINLVEDIKWHLLKQKI